MIPTRSLQLLTLALALATGARAEVVVVVNPRSGITSLTAEQVAQIYMGATTSFPGGAAASPVDQAEGAPVRDEFLAKVLDKSGAQFKAVWSRLIFSGKGTRPKVAASSAEVRKMVASDPTAIGFVERAAVDNSVRVVLSAR